MEASTLQPTASLAPPRLGIGGPLLRFRSDEQLVALFRAGSEDAFRAIHDRYQKRLFAYTRQMLPARQDAEDALQDVFVRAYSGLRASDRDLALRAWLFRVAHNRCIDELRKPPPPTGEVLELVRCTAHDPVAEVDLRESFRRLVEDIRRLPGQQRSALLMRELGGMSYAELASSLGISVGAVKSLLVRARIALAQAAEARDTACAVIREQLVEAHDRGVRPTANTRKHVRDCSGCKSFRRELRGVSRQLAAMVPAAGPLGVLAKLAGFSGGGGAGGSAALVGGGGSAATTGGVVVGVNHVATLIVAAVATAGGAVEIQHTMLPPLHHLRHHHAVVRPSAQPASLPTITNSLYLTTVRAPTGEATRSLAAPSRAMIIHASPVAPTAGGGPRAQKPRRKHAHALTSKLPATQTATQPTSAAGSSSTSVNTATAIGGPATNPSCTAGATPTNQSSSPAAAPDSGTASAGGSTTPSATSTTSTSCGGPAPSPTASTTPAAGGSPSAGGQDAAATGSGPSPTAGPTASSSSSTGTAATAAS